MQSAARIGYSLSNINLCGAAGFAISARRKRKTHVESAYATD